MEASTQLRIADNRHKSVKSVHEETAFTIGPDVVDFLRTKGHFKLSKLSILLSAFGFAKSRLWVQKADNSAKADHLAPMAPYRPSTVRTTARAVLVLTIGKTGVVRYYLLD